MNSNYNIDEQVGTIWLREIEDEMLQVSLEMSKLRGLSSVGHNLSSVASYLHTVRRPEDRQTNSRCLLLREANYELCKPLELPFYKRDVKAIQTEALHQSCTAENISSQSEIQRVQLKPIFSKSRNSKITKSTKKSARVVPQIKKSAESESRCNSTSSRKEIVKDVVEHNIFPEDQQGTEPPSAKNGGPIYKVLAVTSHCQIQREKRSPKVISKINDCSRSTFKSKSVISTENSRSESYLVFLDDSILHPYSLFLILLDRIVGEGSRRCSVYRTANSELITSRVVRVSDGLANAIGADGDVSLKAAPESVDEPVRHDPHEIAPTQSAPLDAPKVNSDEIAPINEVHVSVEKMPDNRAGSIEVAKSKSNAALVRSDRCSFEDMLRSLQKELRDIRHLLEDTKSKVPNSSVSASSMGHDSDEEFD